MPSGYYCTIGQHSKLAHSSSIVRDFYSVHVRVLCGGDFGMIEYRGFVLKEAWMNTGTPVCKYWRVIQRR